MKVFLSAAIPVFDSKAITSDYKQLLTITPDSSEITSKFYCKIY